MGIFKLLLMVPEVAADIQGNIMLKVVRLKYDYACPILAPVADVPWASL